MLRMLAPKYLKLLICLNVVSDNWIQHVGGVGILEVTMVIVFLTSIFNFTASLFSLVISKTY